MTHRYCLPLAVAVALVPAAASANPLPDYTDASSQLPVNPNPAATDTLDVDFIDVDGDGDLDLFVAEGTASPAPRPNLLFINDGTGNFSDQTFFRLPPVVANTTEVDAADVDGDGDLDLFIANLGPNNLFLNDGNGFFTDATPTNLPPPDPNFLNDISAEARFADVDGDGDPDVLVSNENPFDPMSGGQNRLLINDGTGSFTDETAGRLPTAIDQTSGFAVGDIDTDGDADLIVVNIGGNRVLLNDGGGFFTDETATLHPGDPARSSRKGVLGDIDGDSCLDLVVGNSRAEPNELWLGDCDGFFTDGSSMMPADTATTTDIDLVDVDGDGDLDVYVTNAGQFLFGHGFLGEPNVLLVNKNGNKLKDKTSKAFPAESRPSTNAEFGDVDGDGDLDLCVANSTETGGDEILWIAD